MPLENTSRSPRRANCRGRNPSWPRIEARIGKPLKAVFAASTRIAAVKRLDRVEAQRVVAEHGAGDLGDHGALLVPGRGADQLRGVVRRRAHA